MRLKRVVAVFLLVMPLVTGCGGDAVDDKEPLTKSVRTDATQEKKDKVTPAPKPTPEDDKYVHGEDGYFNLDEAGVPVQLRAQSGGTCWLFAAAVSMETGYEIAHGKEIKIDPMKLLKPTYGEDKEEGYFLDGVGAREFGGVAPIVIHSLSNGFGFDGYVLDRGINLPDQNPETIKKYIKKYGAMYIGIPDGNAQKKAYFEGYTTLNFVTDDPKDYDHSIAIVGWDDHFPKKDFFDEASQDGAWITANSQANSDYYYVSYDTKPDYMNDVPVFLSMTDEYTHVATHDCGYDEENPIKDKKGVTLANVFHDPGKLGAVGTYSLKKNQDIVIKVYDDKFKKCIYTQKEHLKDTGYQVIKLSEPIDVSDYAIAVTYTKGKAPVEGKYRKYDDGKIIFKPKSKKGESFIKLGKKWYDLNDKNTGNIIGRKDKINNCCIKGLYV